MKFRVVQSLSVAVPFFQWVVKTVSHPKLHPTMLLMAMFIGVVSEVSYRLGRQSIAEKTE